MHHKLPWAWPLSLFQFVATESVAKKNVEEFIREYNKILSHEKEIRDYFLPHEGLDNWYACFTHTFPLPLGLPDDLCSLKNLEDIYFCLILAFTCAIEIRQRLLILTRRSIKKGSLVQRVVIIYERPPCRKTRRSLLNTLIIKKCTAHVVSIISSTSS